MLSCCLLYCVTPGDVLTAAAVRVGLADVLSSR